jgi:bacteriocin biosynthesis cyclodehydratase domain-containing protein
MKSQGTRRPRLALPFTVVTEPDTVRLVAGEDFRYTLTAPGLDRWLPALLSGCDGRRLLSEITAPLPEPSRHQAQELLERLYGERVLVDGTAAAAHTPALYRPQVEGTGPLVERLSRATVEGDGVSAEVAILCQDSLDYETALAFNRRCLAGGSPWLWVTTGPLNRGYVSPVFLPDAGPCLACLLHNFQRLSPAPELYDSLRGHAQQGGVFVPASFPEPGLGILEQLVRWKVVLLAAPLPPPALYQLHVLEEASMETSAHRVFVDPECPECTDARLV